MANSNTTTKLITLDNLETYHGLMDAKKEEHSVELTQAQYDALTPAEKMNGKTYYITDADPEYGSDYATADSVAPVEENSTSSADYAVDDYIYRNGKLYKVIAAISIGDSFVVNTNIRETRISDEFGSGDDPGANRIVKTEYTLNLNSWSSSSVALYEQRFLTNPMLDANYPVNVYLGTNSIDPFPDESEIVAYNDYILGGLLETTSVDPTSYLTIYASDIPSYRGTPTTLKIWVEGALKEVD